MSKDFFHEDPENWKWGFLYFNKKDHRILVPKRNPIMGWTFNFAHPAGYIFLIIILLLIVLQTVYS
ncbi:MAG: DUF5808 domain-containing protein [Pedobacter sp.]|uniref:DUF5808 domain-containing protein n=1 Tax=Pedobacter sp. TaxID=1411316 RepID=UPI0028082954|nr:DUF5808 domain-containing protein [Pedobacter sp.]MDQ8005423.1 DUF5808 domain-containing protein [Pedobacter sp.]